MAAFQFDHEAGAADHPRVVRRRMHLHFQRTADAAVIKANHDLRQLYEQVSRVIRIDLFGKSWEEHVHSVYAECLEIEARPGLVVAGACEHFGDARFLAHVELQLVDLDADVEIGR